MLMLAAELERHDTDEGRRWAETLRPLALVFAERFKAFLPLAAACVVLATGLVGVAYVSLLLDWCGESCRPSSRLGYLASGSSGPWLARAMRTPSPSGAAAVANCT